MEETTRRRWWWRVQSLLLVASLTLNLIVWLNLHVGGRSWRQRSDNGRDLSWSRRAAEEAELAAAVTCSGHGRVFLDGLVVDGRPVCECFGCFGGPDCSQIRPGCVSDADSGNPLFLEPFWRKHAASSAVLVSGWHRMAYQYEDGSVISRELEKHIRQVHAVVGNAFTVGKFIVFGAGSTQLLNAAVHALAVTGRNDSRFPARVVASIPFYPAYEVQTNLFRSADFKFEGDASLWKNSTSSSDDHGNFVEFVTSPNNPDGQLKQAVLEGPLAKTILDRAYYWPHFTAIPAPANDDLMIFTISKLTGHAGSRFGWALIRDESVYQRMKEYIDINTIGVSKDTQLRAMKLLKVVIEERGKEIFGFGFETMSSRWEKLTKILSVSKRLSAQKIDPLYCNYFQKVRKPSPAYAWLKCEMESEGDCATALSDAGIIGRNGSRFHAGNRFVRLSLIKSQDDFDLLIQKLKDLVSQEGGGSKTCEEG